MDARSRGSAARNDSPPKSLNPVFFRAVARRASSFRSAMLGLNRYRALGLNRYSVRARALNSRIEVRPARRSYRTSLIGDILAQSPLFGPNIDIARQPFDLVHMAGCKLAILPY